MAFRFTLEAVLRYRRSLEDREQMRLQLLLSRRVALQEEWQRALAARRQAQTTLHQDLLQALTPAIEVQFWMAGLRGLESREELLRFQLQQLQAEVALQMTHYQQARRRREVLESLRTAQLSDYRLQQQRREQARLDEMYLLRHGRS